MDRVGEASCLGLTHNSMLAGEQSQLLDEVVKRHLPFRMSDDPKERKVGIYSVVTHNKWVDYMKPQIALTLLQHLQAPSTSAVKMNGWDQTR